MERYLLSTKITMVSSKENGLWGSEVAREDMERTIHRLLKSYNVLQEVTVA